MLTHPRRMAAPQLFRETRLEIVVHYFLKCYIEAAIDYIGTNVMRLLTLFEGEMSDSEDILIEF